MNQMDRIITLLSEQVNGDIPNRQNEALEEIVFLFKSQDEHLDLSIYAYDALVKLSHNAKDAQIKARALDALALYPNPNIRFKTWEKQLEFGDYPRYWMPNSNYPDIVPVEGGLFIMGSDENTGLKIREIVSNIGSDKDITKYISEVMAKKFLEQGHSEILSYEDERPKHIVYLENFHIGKCQVTNSQYALFIKETGYHRPQHWESSDIPSSLADFPITHVSWFDAMEYCKWLTTHWRRQGNIKENYEVRLPTEAEWEKAARGNEGNLFPWGSEFSAALCNFSLSGFDLPLPVGYYHDNADSPYGCKGMAGNAWDWTSSIWGNNSRHPSYGYPYQFHDGRENILDTNTRRVIRGGAFYYYVDCLRCSVRNRNYPFTLHPGGSFRIVTNVVKEEQKENKLFGRKI